MQISTRGYSGSTNGFTLVELAIVLGVIGLLIGGFLKGREMIQNARLQGAIGQVESMSAAITTFKDQYSALPGDISNPGRFLADCTAAPCNIGGNGDGYVSCCLGETDYVAVHLAAANLISGYNPNGTGGTPNLVAGRPDYLALKHMPGIIVTETIPAPAMLCGGAASLLGPPASFSFGGLQASLGQPGCVSMFTPNQAFYIDHKLDDGFPGAGYIWAWAVTNPTADCGSATAYAENNPDVSCGLYIRLE